MSHHPHDPRRGDLNVDPGTWLDPSFGDAAEEERGPPMTRARLLLSVGLAAVAVGVVVLLSEHDTFVRAVGSGALGFALGCVGDASPGPDGRRWWTWWRFAGLLGSLGMFVFFLCMLAYDDVRSSPDEVVWPAAAAMWTGIPLGWLGEWRDRRRRRPMRRADGGGLPPRRPERQEAGA